MENNERFRILINDGLKRKNISLRALCRLARLDPSFMSKVLAGKRNPPTDTPALTALSAALDCPQEVVFIAVGRLPQAWEKLTRDAALLNQVSRLITDRPVMPEQHRPAAYVPATAQKKMPEELL